MTTQTGLAFLNEYKSKSTRNSYLSAIRQFFKLIYPDAPDSVYELADHYLKEERKHEDDIKAFVHSLSKRPPKTTRLYLAAVKMFLLENDIELPQIFWHRLNRGIKGSRARTQDRVPSNDQLRKIITHIPIRGKALFLLLASSGMRIGEALQLDISDIELTANTVRIRGEYTKTGNPRYAFFTDETKEHIIEWQRNRDAYLKQAVAKSTLNKKKINDTRVFPFENTTAYAMWRNALTKTQNVQRDPTTNRHRLHPHVLRKFFRSKLGTVIPVDIVEALMGHEGYLTEVYRRHSVEQLAQFYKEGEHVLQIFGRTEQLSHLKQEVNEQTIQLQQLSRGFTATLAENKALTTQITQLEQELNELKAKMEVLDALYEVAQQNPELLKPMSKEKLVYSEASSYIFNETDELPDDIKYTVQYDRNQRISRIEGYYLNFEYKPFPKTIITTVE